MGWWLKMVSYPIFIPLGQRYGAWDLSYYILIENKPVRATLNIYYNKPKRATVQQCLRSCDPLHGGIRRPISDLQPRALRVARRAHRPAIIPRVVSPVDLSAGSNSMFSPYKNPWCKISGRSYCHRPLMWSLMCSWRQKHLKLCRLSSSSLVSPHVEKLRRRPDSTVFVLFCFFFCIRRYVIRART